MRDLRRRVRTDRERPSQEVGDRAVRAVRVVWRAARARDTGAQRSRIGEELVNESCLSEPRLADDRNDVSPSGERFVEGPQKRRDFLIAADQRRAPAIRRGGLDAKEPPRDERRGLALRRDGRMRFVREEARSEPVGGVTDQDLSRLRRLLEPRRDVHGVAEHPELALLVTDSACHSEPGVDSDPQREIAARAFGDAFVLAVEGAEDREGGPLCARRMVDLVVDRAEHRDDGVSDVLLDEAAGRPDLHGDRIPCGAHVLVELFRTEALRQRGESGDVREEDRDLLGLTFDRCERQKPRAAFSTEAERDRHLGRALRTGECRSPHRPAEVTSAALSFGCRPGVLASPPFR